MEACTRPPTCKDGRRHGRAGHHQELGVVILPLGGPRAKQVHAGRQDVRLQNVVGQLESQAEELLGVDRWPSRGELRYERRLLAQTGLGCRDGYSGPARRKHPNGVVISIWDLGFAEPRWMDLLRGSERLISKKDCFHGAFKVLLAQTGLGHRDGGNGPAERKHAGKKRDGFMLLVKVEGDTDDVFNDENGSLLPAPPMAKLPLELEHSRGCAADVLLERIAVRLQHVGPSEPLHVGAQLHLVGAPSRHVGHDNGHAAGCLHVGDLLDERILAPVAKHDLAAALGGVEGAIEATLGLKGGRGGGYGGTGIGWGK